MKHSSAFQATQQQQNNIEGFDAAQQPTAHAAEVDVADAVVDAANVGAADPAAAAAPRPNRRPQTENRRQPQQQLFLPELVDKFASFLNYIQK